MYHGQAQLRICSGTHSQEWLCNAERQAALPLI